MSRNLRKHDCSEYKKHEDELQNILHQNTQLPCDKSHKFLILDATQNIQCQNDQLCCDVNRTFQKQDCTEEQQK